MLVQHTTKFQLNKALSVHCAARRMKGENAGLCVEDHMSDACSSLSCLSFYFHFFKNCILAQRCSFSPVFQRGEGFHLILFCLDLYQSILLRPCVFERLPITNLLASGQQSFYVLPPSVQASVRTHFECAHVCVFVCVALLECRGQEALTSPKA